MSSDVEDAADVAERRTRGFFVPPDSRLPGHSPLTEDAQTLEQLIEAADKEIGEAG